MQLIKNIFTKEFANFERLSKDGQRLIQLFVPGEIISPLIGLFVGAYLWRQTNDIWLPAYFYLANYVFLPIGFIINSYIVKRFGINLISRFSIVLMGIIPAMVVFWEASIIASVFAGILCGVLSGIYWANRNFLSVVVTNDDNRNYFTGIEISLSLITGILAPLFYGWFIVAGERWGLYSVEDGYKMLVIGVVGMVALMLPIIGKVNFKEPKISGLFLKGITPLWLNMRLFLFVDGIYIAARALVPPILILKFLGDEGTLGTIQSLSTIVAAFLIYSLGKRLGKERRVDLLKYSTWILLGAACILAIFYSNIGVIIYILITTVTNPFYSKSMNTILFTAVEKEMHGSDSDFKHLLDLEIFLNIGRVTGLFIFIFINYYLSQDTGLRFILLLLAFLNLLTIRYGRKVVELTYK